MLKKDIVTVKKIGGIRVKRNPERGRPKKKWIGVIGEDMRT